MTGGHLYQNWPKADQILLHAALEEYVENMVKRPDELEWDLDVIGMVEELLLRREARMALHKPTIDSGVCGFCEEPFPCPDVAADYPKGEA